MCFLLLFGLVELGEKKEEMVVSVAIRDMFLDKLQLYTKLLRQLSKIYTSFQSRLIKLYHIFPAPFPLSALFCASFLARKHILLKKRYSILDRGVGVHMSENKIIVSTGFVCDCCRDDLL